MNPIKIELPEEYRDLVQAVKQYGYDSDLNPCCGKDECESELDHLICDWKEDAGDFQAMQIGLGLSDISFEQLLGAIYVASDITFMEDFYKWRLKDTSAAERWLIFTREDDSEQLLWSLVFRKHTCSTMTESELRNYLLESGCTFKFEDFERVEIDGKD